ncbi:MAG: hypothetical protein V1847_03695 [Candidatus Diapherotrites archaeon]
MRAHFWKKEIKEAKAPVIGRLKIGTTTPSGWQLKRIAGKNNILQVWTHADGSRFVRFADAPLLPEEIPLASQIPRDYNLKQPENDIIVGYVTRFPTSVGGKKRIVWAKQAIRSQSFFSMEELEREKKFEDRKPENRIAFNPSVHEARMQRQLRAAGFEAAEPLGILYEKDGTVWRLTLHVEGKRPSGRARNRLEKNLKKAGFRPQDVRADNFFQTKKGPTLLDVEHFYPTRKPPQKPQPTRWQRVRRWLGLE